MAHSYIWMGDSLIYEKDKFIFYVLETSNQFKQLIIPEDHLKVKYTVRIKLMIVKAISVRSQFLLKVALSHRYDDLRAVTEYQESGVQKVCFMFVHFTFQVKRCQKEKCCGASFQEEHADMGIG